MGVGAFKMAIKSIRIGCIFPLDYFGVNGNVQTSFTYGLISYYQGVWISR